MNIIITGATAGFGKAIATHLAAENQNHEIWITGRRTDKLYDLKQDLEARYKVVVHTSSFDIRNSKEVEKFQKQVIEKWNCIDVLINNAGLALGLSTIDKGDIEDWDIMIDTNIKGLLYATRAFSPQFVQQQHGHIINIGSIAGKDVYPNGNVYCATKHAVDAISKSTRIDLLPYNIKVTGINPGMAETEFSIVRFKGDKEKAAKTYQGYIPLSADDIAEVVVFCINLPKHVCINDLTITPTQQANGVFKQDLLN